MKKGKKSETDKNDVNIGTKATVNSEHQEKHVKNRKNAD